MAVSALMATTKRRASFLPRALESFRQQQFPDQWQVELVIDEHETNSLGRKLNDMANRGRAFAAFLRSAFGSSSHALSSLK
jgi:hypothetical protein